MNDWKKLAQLRPWLTPFLREIVLLLGLSVIFWILAQLNPFFIQSLLDRAIPSGRVSAVLLVIAGYLGLLLTRHGFNVLTQMLYARLGARILIQIQHDLLDHLLSVDLRFFHQRKLGEILACVNDDAQVVRDFLSETVVDIISHLITLIASLIIMAVFNWKLALATGLLLPLIPLPFNLMRAQIRQAAAEQRTVHGTNVSFISEVLSAALPIRIAGARSFLLRQHADVGGRLISVMVRQNLVMTTAAFSAEIAGNLLSPILVLGLGGILVLRDELTVGQLIAAEMYAARLAMPAVQLSRIGGVIQRVLASVDRLDDILATPRLVEPQLHLASKIPVGVSVKNVTFGYEGEQPVLQDVSLDVVPRCRMAIVGPSGAGKTTLVHLLAGILRPDVGSVLVGGAEVSHLANRADVISVVPQDPFLFHSSVAANIAFGAGDVSRQEIRSAAAAAQVDHVIDALPAGYDTVVGERGVSLSGGERQRIVLARALLRRPSLLILDEVTSALDGVTEQRVLKALSALSDETTVLLVTHRISRAMSADQVCVLDAGRLVEQGRPADLLARRGILYHLAAAQQRGE